MLFCGCILLPIVNIVPGSDHGVYENSFNTLEKLHNSPECISRLCIFLVLSLLYNMGVIVVIALLSAMWYPICDAICSVLVWISSLLVFYLVSESLGAGWMAWSWLQLVAICFLIYGLSIYNAPHAMSLKLMGQWYALGIDLSGEYNCPVPSDATAVQIASLGVADDELFCRDESLTCKPTARTLFNPRLVQVHPLAQEDIEAGGPGSVTRIDSNPRS
jgi:hypothetical protein